MNFLFYEFLVTVCIASFGLWHVASGMWKMSCGLRYSNAAFAFYLPRERTFDLHVSKLQLRQLWYNS